MTRKKLLGLLLLLLAAALAYAYWGSPRPEQAERGRDTLASSRPKGTSKVAGKDEDARRVRLELLQEDEAAFPGFKRNIFGSILPPPPPPPPRPAPVMPPPPPRPAPAVTVPTEMQQELARFTFLGYLEREGVRRVFLSGENELYVVGKDDRFGKNRRFHVVSLTADKLVIRQGDDPRDIVITLVERTPLALESTPFRRGAGPSRDFPPPRRAGSLRGAPPVPAEEEPIPGDQPAGDQEATGAMSPIPGRPPVPGTDQTAPPPTPSPSETDSPLRSLPSDILSPVVPGPQMRE